MAGHSIAAGQLVIEYCGEVFSVESEIGIDRLEQTKENKCVYMMNSERGEVIDPTKKGNLARFVNHSCQPNCATQKWLVNGETAIALFSTRMIKENEEITYDY